MDNIHSDEIKAFVITIIDLNESFQSSEKTITSAKQFGFTSIERFPAYTPINSNITELFEENGLPSTDKFLCTSPKKNNVMACFLSHLALWKKSIELNEPILILEHDAIFHLSFEDNTIPQFNGLLSIGRPSFGRFRVPAHKGVNILSSKQFLPGAHAYIIKPDAAKDLIKQAKRVPKPVDVFLHISTFPWLQEYYPWIAHVEESFSTLQVKCIAKHDYQKNPENYKIIDVL